jgi:hypothetical protein
MMAISPVFLILLNDSLIYPALDAPPFSKADRLNAFADELLKFFLDGEPGV